MKFSHPKIEMEQRLQAIGPVGAAQEQVPSLYGEDRTDTNLSCLVLGFGKGNIQMKSLSPEHAKHKI